MRPKNHIANEIDRTPPSD